MKLQGPGRVAARATPTPSGAQMRLPEGVGAAHAAARNVRRFWLPRNGKRIESRVNSRHTHFSLAPPVLECRVHVVLSAAAEQARLGKRA